MKLLRNNETHGQMIVLMGILLALSIFVISSLAADIINLDIVISNERASLLSDEFETITDTFGDTLNYNLVDEIEKEIVTNPGGLGGEYTYTLRFIGNISQLRNVFNQTRDQYFTLQLSYGNIFDAKLNKYWYSHAESDATVYYVDVTLSLSNKNTVITNDVQYSIICNIVE